ncbi:MAG: hypothetical protein PVI90_18740 [Desulfobacteraceae bacterium]|jgi:hypothetical protein
MLGSNLSADAGDDMDGEVIDSIGGLSFFLFIRTSSNAINPRGFGGQRPPIKSDIFLV